MLRTARRVAHHERGKLALLQPVAWLATLHTTAWAADALEAHPLIRVGVITATAVVVLGNAERRGQDLPIVNVAAGVLWAAAASLFGPYGWVALLLWIAGIILSVPYVLGVLRRPRPKVAPAAKDQPAQQKTAAVAPEVALWQERVAPNSSPQAFKVTALEQVEPVPNGYTGIIVGEPGTTRFSQMILPAAVETIASANQVHPSRVAVEDCGDGDASRARVTVIRSESNLQETIWLEDSGAAIDPKTGIARVGTFFDLQPARRQFWTPSGGAQMGVVAGDTGSGKSAHVSALLALAHRCPLIATALLDPQDGSSQPDWSGRTPIYGEGHEATYENLQMFDFVMAKRAHYVAHAPWVDDLGRERKGKPYLLPGDPDLNGMTMILVCVEELKLFLDGPFGALGYELLSTGVRTWRKAGGGLLVVNQNLGLDNFFNKQSFRSNLLSGGSLTALRTGSSQDHGMVGLPSDPSKLPEYFRDGSKTHGLGYLTGVDRRPGATARMMPVRDAFGIASTPAAGQLGERTLAWMDEYRHHKTRGRDPRQTKPAHSESKTSQPTSGDVQAAVEKALLNGPMEVGKVCAAVRQQIGENVPLSEIPAALRALTKAGVARQKGDVYQMVPNES
ncbi:hypothetical protein E1286_05340 [Nonomuraea terrae]|uniref:FtsK domain-containing protein n=1 Tax=Nonomuraea terrae TaxID=2530383 RepID=A0A4R4ZB65_9ACTN|nr:hypothetical protein [Nonomuraea terrae]TDD54614.1 hypothetical protein E1286_05340 [Nonomuraea terrae]